MQIDQGPVADKGVLDLSREEFVRGKRRMVPMQGSAVFRWGVLEGTNGLDGPMANHDGEVVYRDISKSWVQPDSFGSVRPAHGYATYHVKIILPTRQQQFGLWLGSIGTAHRLWINDQLVSQAGVVGRTPDASRPDLSRAIIPLPYEHEVNLTLHVSNWDARRGGPWESSHLGLLDHVEAARMQQDLRQMLVFGSMCVGSVFFFIIYLTWRRDRSFLYFAGVAMLAGIRASVVGSRLAYHMLPDAFQLLFRLDYLTFFLIVPLFVYFMRIFLSIPGSKLADRTFMVVALLCAVVVLIFPVSWFTFLTFPYQAIAIISLLYALYLLVRSVLSRRREAYILLVGFSVLAVTLLSDIMLARGTALLLQFESGSIGVLLFLFPIAVLLGIRTARFSRDNFNLSHTLGEVNAAMQKFVPQEFLRVLQSDIRAIGIGQAVETELTVMFVDIRGFTRLSESLGAMATMRFLNGYFGRTNPVVRAHNGFVDKFLGDGFMALFPIAEDAISCAVELQITVHNHNNVRRGRGWEPIEIAVGISTGKIAVGTVGDQARMETTVVGDTVNLASRLEAMSKKLGCSVLLSANSRKQIQRPIALREIDHIHVRGLSEAVTIYECFESDPAQLRAEKQLAEGDLTRGLAMLQAGEVAAAYDCFLEAARKSPADPIPPWRLELARTLMVRAGQSKMVAKVLVAEDNEMISTIIRHRLKTRELSVSYARSCAEATRLYSNMKFDIAIFDLHLPDGSGLDLIHELRLQPHSGETTFALLTADDTDAVRHAANALGVRFYRKPDGIAELAADLTNWSGVNTGSPA
ncbi:MAG: response regulator [Leptospirales bacterium]|nr:response regulator [Leptospirales bacterium]